MLEVRPCVALGSWSFGCPASFATGSFASASWHRDMCICIYIYIYIYIYIHTHIVYIIYVCIVIILIIIIIIIIITVVSDARMITDSLIFTAPSWHGDAVLSARLPHASLNQIASLEPLHNRRISLPYPINNTQ